MTELQWIERLKEEGYEPVGTPRFPAGDVIPEHRHDETTVHIILEGELTFEENGSLRNWRAGDRFEVPAGTVHKGTVGPAGCSFIVGARTGPKG